MFVIKVLELCTSRESSQEWSANLQRCMLAFLFNVVEAPERGIYKLFFS